ncbi:GyrI-like domain-containing protein [Paenibacillus sp. MBLB4367]|uniref:GyrI-like domain-containing protein n=1 Tax=Paenibacillus sp. MBLB4367 TaxID=3384767 RepID=UPI0039080F7F
MKIKELHKMKLVGLRIVCHGDQYAVEIPKAAIRLKERLHEIKQALDPIRLVGAFYPGDFTEEEDGYWVCVEVKDDSHIPDGMVCVSVPSQKYAVIRHEGPNTGIQQTYEYLHKRIAEQGLKRIPRAWHLEIAEEWGRPDIAEVKVDLYDTIE